jgi:small subunit ribosomal protein S17
MGKRDEDEERMASEAPAAAPTAATQKRKLIGLVVSDKRDKTITVEVRRVVKHPLYGKYLNRSTNYHAHDEKEEAKEGDRVEIEETRPLSKQKHWRLLRIVERAARLGPLELKEVEIPQAKRGAPAPAEAKAEKKAEPEAPPKAP